MMQTLIFMTFSGFLMSIVYYVFNFIYDYIKRRIVSSITLESSDDVYKIVLNFLTHKNYLKGSMT